MKTIIDRRFLIGLLIGTLVLGAAVHGLHAVQINRQSRFLLEEAHRALKEKQYELAMNRFRQYIRLAPEDSDAQAEFGLLLADHNASQEAVVTLETVLRAQPDRDDLRRRLASLEMEIGRSSDAKLHLKRLLDKSPDDAALWGLLGTCLVIGGEYAPATDLPATKENKRDFAIFSLQQSIALDSSQVDTYALLADVLRRLHRPNEADTWMEKMVPANPKSARAHLLDGHYLAETGRAKEARSQAEKALELAPKDSGALLLAAQLALASASNDKARDYAQRAIDAAPTNAVPYMTLARIESLAGHRKEAIACLETGADKTQSRDRSLLWELGRLRIEAGDLKGAQEIVDTLRKLPSADRFEPLIDYLAAQIELASNRWQPAIQQLGQVAAELTQSPDLLKQVRLQVASCYERLGNTDLQLAAYQQAAAVDPTWPPARLGIAGTFLALGKFDEALEEYRQIGKLDGMAGAGTAGVAKLLILKNMGRRPVEQKEYWAEVDALLDQLARNNPDSVGVTLLRAESLSGQQRAAEAEKLLLTARTKSPDRIELWTALIGLANRHEQWSRAEQLLAEADKKFGDRVWLRLAHGSYLLAHYKQESASKLRALGEGTEALSTADRAKLFRALTSLSVQAGETMQAVVFARRACDADPKNLEARLFLFDLAFGNGDEPSVNQALKEIRDLEGEGPFWHYGQAALCLLAKPATSALDEAAFRHIDAARKLRPGWTALSLLTAQIQDRQGQSGPALQNYLEAIDLGERSPRAIRRAIELLYARQRYSEADQLLRRLEQQPTLFSGDVERMASKVSARLDDLDRALDLARKVAADSSNWQDQVWLGQLQSLVGLQAQRSGRADEASGRFAEAEKSLRSAVQFKPDVPEPWVALIRFYVAIGRKPDAETAIRQAERKLTAKTAALALASCYEAIGNAEEASKQYHLALSRSASDPRVVRTVAEFEMRSGKPADAEAHLRTIVSGQVAAKPDEVVSARRALAEVLRASGSYPKIQQALALVEQNLAGTQQPIGAAPEDLREKAFALALCPQPERRREAIDILEGLLPVQPAADDLRVALSQLYLAEKDWPKASKQLRNLISSHEKESGYIIIYVSQLLKRQETDEAELWIHRLEQIAPNDFATVGLRAEALIQRGKIDSAIQELHDSLTRAKLSADEAAKQTRHFAGRLEALANGMAGAGDTVGPDQSAGAARLLAEAESMYRDYVKMQPDRQLVLAAFLARRGRVDEAMTLIERARPTADPNALAQACVELIGGEPGGADPDNRLEKLLLGAIKQHGEAATLRICLADVRMRQERFDEAAAIYRDVLEKDPSNTVAMNDLAILLAFEKKDLDEAQRLVEKAIATAGPLSALLDSRASVYLALGKPAKALTDLEQAISADPRPNRHFHRALAYFQLGQTQAATEALGEARKLRLKPEELNPLERSAYRDLAAKLQRLGG